MLPNSGTDGATNGSTNPDSDENNGLNLLRRLWVVKFDVEDEIQKLAER